ncbi:hypothetical protein AKJ16_DCAP12217 [Drosera capensis]
MTMVFDDRDVQSDIERELTQERLQRRGSVVSSAARIGEGCLLLVMEPQSKEHPLPGPRVKATLVLGSETYTVNVKGGILSEQLASMKEESMSILKDFIIKHNVPNDVPDEPLEGSSGEEDDLLEKPPVKTKRRK